MPYFVFFESLIAVVNSGGKQEAYFSVPGLGEKGCGCILGFSPVGFNRLGSALNIQ
jgi:hypothetical protein